MKNIFRIIILFGIWNCNSQSQIKNEEEIRLKLNTEFNKNTAKCSYEISAVTDFNEKVEFWRICNLENKNRIIKIESYKQTEYFQEIYFERNGDLVYAKETENYIPKNHFTQIVWNCQFYTQNGKLITLISHGHGKTEDDEWNHEIIFKMYKKRLLELKRIKN